MMSFLLPTKESSLRASAAAHLSLYLQQRSEAEGEGWEGGCSVNIGGMRDPYEEFFLLKYIEENVNERRQYTTLHYGKIRTKMSIWKLICRCYINQKS